MKAGIILNLNATGFKSNWRKNRIRESAKKMGALIRETRSLEDMEKAIDEFAEREIELLILGGGDGTIQRTITYIFNRFANSFDPLFFHLPLGATNVFSKNLEMNSTPIRLLWTLRRRTGKGNFTIKKVPTIKITGTTLSESLYGFIFTAGVGYNLTRKYRELPPGTSSILKVVSNSIMEFISYTLSGMGEEPWYLRRINIHLKTKDNSYPYDKALIVLASIFPNPLLWFSPFYRKDKIAPEGNFYLLANSMSNREIAQNLISLFSGRKKFEKSFNDTINRAELTLNEGFALDGELFELNSENSFTLSAGPSLRVVYFKAFYSRKRTGGEDGTH